ncbi:hypothetical protein I316_01850 [Kwoniella heveanensis BCC8398]|uniref:Uncharacterized protein n=1 Tax=Kwoniella heveanensis BCC8398 TaxID=1296120 RepID=A0A1B9H013_9TREE|nr:hypothetical protein I316_01850 [Kwoniella heveanensis BCC8398]
MSSEQGPVPNFHPPPARQHRQTTAPKDTPHVSIYDSITIIVYPSAQDIGTLSEMEQKVDDVVQRTPKVMLRLCDDLDTVEELCDKFVLQQVRNSPRSPMTITLPYDFLQKSHTLHSFI